MDGEITKEKKFVKDLLHLDDISRITYVDSGWTSRVYVVDDGRFVAKFPRNEITKKEYIQEIAILKVIDEINSNVLVPEIYLTHANNDYLIYKGIVGKALDTLPQEMDDTLQQKVGTDLGNFLKQLHSIELPGGSIITVEDEITQFQQKYEASKSVLDNELSNDEKNALQTLVYLTLPNELKKIGYDKALCHGDLGYWNMILNDNHQIGIIDFGDIGYWDRSKDFIGMEGSVMLDAALAVYGDDTKLRQKIALRKRVLSFLDLPFYIGKKDKEGINKTVQKIKKMLAE